MIGVARLETGDAAGAVPSLERALKMRERPGTRPRELAETRFALARASWDAGGDRARAIELARAAAEADRGNVGRAEALAAEEAWLRSRG